MTLREQAAVFVAKQGIKELAERLGKKESTVISWAKTGNYPLDLIELMLSQPPPAINPDDYPEVKGAQQGTREWTPEDLDRLEASMVAYGERLQELNVRLIDIEDRHNPKPVVPQIPSSTVPPVMQDDSGFVAANQVRPGPVAPTPHLIRGEAPPAMMPHPQNRYSTWLEPFRPRERR